MDLKERYTSQANNLLGRLDEDYDKNIEPTHMSQKSKPFSRDELRAKGMLSIADDDEEFARYQEYMSDEDAYDEGYEEEIRAAQDNPENNGEEETLPASAGEPEVGEENYKDEEATQYKENLEMRIYKMLGLGDDWRKIDGYNRGLVQDFAKKYYEYNYEQE